MRNLAQLGTPSLGLVLASTLLVTVACSDDDSPGDPPANGGSGSMGGNSSEPDAGPDAGSGGSSGGTPDGDAGVPSGGNGGNGGSGGNGGDPDAGNPNACQSDDPCECDPDSAACAATCPAGCAIGDACVTTGTVNEGNPCQVCDPTLSREGWSNRDVACDDGFFCTTGDTCVEGACVGEARVCDDGIACNGVSTCDEDADLCTPFENQCLVTETCNMETGECDTTCDGCVIEGTCVPTGTEQPDDECRICDPVQALDAFSISEGKACGSAASECSAQDTCDAAGACQPNHAAQGAPCGDPDASGCNLADACDGAGACENRIAADGANCEDGLFCTIGDECLNGDCQPNATRSCGSGQTCDDDVNACVDTGGGGACESDGFSGQPAAPTNGSLVPFASSLGGDCPNFSPVENQTWAIVGVHFLGDGSADVLIENASSGLENFGDLFSVCNTQPNCVFIHDNDAGIDIAPGAGRMTVNIPNTFSTGGELALYTNNLSIPHTDTVPDSELCDLFGIAFAFDYLAWGSGPSGDHVLYADATRDFNFWNEGDLITINPGDTAFVATGDVTSEDGYTSCEP